MNDHAEPGRDAANNNSERPNEAALFENGNRQAAAVTDSPSAASNIGDATPHRPAAPAEAEAHPDADAQAERTLQRNDELMDGSAPTASGEEAIAGGRTAGSAGNQSGAARGDYSND